ncbi:MAG: YceI family protein [Stagnimonas sp.]|nr:YceI family protein [Stagnimonas sp.]
MKSPIRSLATLALLIFTAAVPAALAIDAAKSTVTATFRQMNVPVDGEFTKLAGSISFDPAHPEAASARIEIETAGFDLGMDDYNAEVRKPEWFDSARHPKASFVSSGFKALGADRYLASGKLSIKGKTIAISLPVTVRREAAVTVFEGSLPVSREAFGIGDPGWNEVLDDSVSLRFHLVQPR